jgi:hypothetical protein
MYRAIVELRFAICCKIPILPVGELTGDAESGFKALDFHAKHLTCLSRTSGVDWPGMIILHPKYSPGENGSLAVQ